MKNAINEKFWRVVLPLAIAVCTLFIWGQSVIPAEKSAAVSQVVEDVLEPAIPNLDEKTTIQPQWWTKYFTVANHPLGISFWIRKAAHLVEFGTLGVLWVACGRVYRRRWLWLCGLATGVIDEWLQSMTPGRGALAADVVVDVAGYLLGAALMMAVLWLWGKKKK